MARVHALGIGMVLGLAVALPARAEPAAALPRLPPDGARSTGTELPPLPYPGPAPDRTESTSWSPFVTWTTPPLQKNADQSADSRSKAEREWYGWQILLVDGASFVGLLAAEGQRATGVADLTVATYFLGGSVVHWAHGSATKGFGSLGLRVGIPLGGAVLGAVIGTAAYGSSNVVCGFPLCSPAVAFGAVGLLLGVVAAPIVDVAVLAYDEQPPARSDAHSASSRLQLTPVAALPRDAAGHNAPTFGLAGSF